MHICKKWSWIIIAILMLWETADAHQGVYSDSLPTNVSELTTLSARKKVAVVLSGGGAKGMAHIGALKVIERAGIPVDIITGTSMGSIIGGLYAIGYNAQLLDSVVRKQDWSYVITDKENLSNQNLADHQKQYTYAFTTGLTLGKRNKNDGGLIKGKNLAELFQQLCVGYTDSLDFNRDLPIPFACVATNIVDNSEVDFHSGRLPQTMRASMAIPAAFSPVRIGDKVLVDGGLRNNFPADIAQQMGADVIIGITVQGAPKLAEDMGGTMSILSQIIDVNCKNKYDENLAITDVPIRVNTTGFNAASFSYNAIDTLIRRGEEEAMRHWDELMALKQRIGMEASFRPARLQPLHKGTTIGRRRVVGFTFENMTPQDERFLRAKFHLNKIDSIDVTLEQQLTTSMRMDLFYQTAECHVVSVKQQKTLHNSLSADSVRVVLTAGNRKTAQFHAGFRYDNEEHAAVQLGVEIPLKASLPLNTDFTFRLGKRLMARGELTFHPMNFTCPTLNYTFRSNDVDVYINDTRDYNILYNQHQAELIPVNFNLRHFNLQAGVRWDYMHYRDKLQASSSKKIELKDEHFFSYRASLNFNSEDNWYFPARGASFKAEYAYLTDNFSQLNGKAGMSAISAHWRKSISIGNRFTLQPMLYGRMLFGATVPEVMGNAIGGEWFGHYVEQQMPFAGAGHLEYVLRQFIAMQLQAQQRIASNHYVQLRLAGGQQSAHFRNLLSQKTLVGCQAAYYYNTMLGPAGAVLGYSSHARGLYFYLNLGYEF